MWVLGDPQKGPGLSLFDVDIFVLSRQTIPATKACSLESGGHIVKKAKKRRSWTNADVSQLKSAARKKIPAGKIARTLKRSEGATRQKAFSMGLSLDSR